MIAYTSLLRITTSLPPISEGDKEGSTTTDAVAEGSTSHGHDSEVRGGIFGTSLLRGLSFNNRNHPGDVESQAGTARVGA